MAKHSTTRSKRAAEPAALTLMALIRSKGLKPQDVASRARIGYSTVYRATQGVMPGDLQVWAIAHTLSLDEADVRAAIAAGATGAA